MQMLHAGNNIIPFQIIFQWFCHVITSYSIHYTKLYEDAAASFGSNPGLWALGLLISAVLLFGRRRARREISRTAEKVNQQRQDSFSLTLRVLALTVYLSVGFPFLIIFVGWQLLQLPGRITSYNVCYTKLLR